MILDLFSYADEDWLIIIKPLFNIKSIIMLK